MITFDPIRFHTADLSVPLHEIDLGQAVYHGNYYHFYNQARDAFFRDTGFAYSLFMERKMHLTVAELSTRFLKSLRYEDHLTIRTGISWWRTRSLGIVQKIERVEDGEPALCSEAEFSMVCVDFDGNARPLPSDFIDVMERWTER